jgi:Phytanoyl-CoA dioxygenase (PhyH)
MSPEPANLKHVPVPVVQFTAAEREAQALAPATLADAVKQFTATGCLHLDGVFPVELVESWRAAFLARHGDFLAAEKFEGTKPVGHRRIQLPVEFSPPFSAPSLYAHPFILPILQALLGPRMFFGIFGSVTSLPGAEAQGFHRDNPLLFGDAINRFLPPYAINLFVPLIEFNDRTGTTRLFPGTHVRSGPEALGHAGVDPVVRVGSCLLMDYRLYHQGTANRSDTIRPMLFCAYHVPWFKDYVNHRAWPFLRIADADYAAIPAEHRAMFAWIEHYRGGLY